jgi:hypothetical protein
LKDLSASAAEGCRLCRSFIRNFVDKGKSLEDFYSRHGERPALMRFTGSETNSTLNGCGLALFWDADNITHAQWMLMGAITSASTISHLRDDFIILV